MSLQKWQISFHLFFHFQSVPTHRLGRSLGSFLPIPCIRTFTFRAIIFYTLKKEAKIPLKWYPYTKLHGVTSSRSLWTERSVLSQERACFMEYVIRCQPSLYGLQAFEAVKLRAPSWYTVPRRLGFIARRYKTGCGLTLKGQRYNEDNNHCYNLQYGPTDAFVFKRIRLSTNMDGRQQPCKPYTIRS